MFRSLLFVAFVGASYGLTLKSWGASSDSKWIFFINLVPTRIFSLLRDFFSLLQENLSFVREIIYIFLLLFLTLVGFRKDERKKLLQKYF